MSWLQRLWKTKDHKPRSNFWKRPWQAHDRRHEMPEMRRHRKISETEPCKTCEGRGKFFTCSVCAKPITKGEFCEECTKKPIVHVLSAECDTASLRQARYMKGGCRDMQLRCVRWYQSTASGLIHASNINISPEIGDKIYVEIKNIALTGILNCCKELEGYTGSRSRKTASTPQDNGTAKYIGKLSHISGEVIQIKQTGGPTIFTISDEDGTVQCAAFEKAGERAYPEIKSETIVKIIGEPAMRNGTMQVEIRAMKQLWEAMRQGSKRLSKKR